MNSTMATKIATMSNVLRTFGSMPPATRSDSRTPGRVSVTVCTLPTPSDDGCRQAPQKTLTCAAHSTAASTSANARTSARLTAV